MISVDRLGDAVMSLPALQLFRNEYPDAEITVLTPPNLAEFWSLCPVIDFFQTLEATALRLADFFPSPFAKASEGKRVGKMKQADYDRAYILPDSFHSAFAPFAAGIPRRIGARGHRRRMMLTEIVYLGSGHQQFEAMSILGVQGNPEPPALKVPAEHFQTLERKFSHFPTLLPSEALAKGGGKTMTALFQTLEDEKPVGARPVVTFLPGADGWPAEQFALLAKNLCSSLHAVVLLAGAPEDAALCREIEAEDYDILNLAGQTTFSEWAALMQASDCVVTHESGGMHLAGAVGTPVVGLYGPGDPKKTGPLFPRHIVLQKQGADGGAVNASLEDIGVDEVYLAVKKLLPKHL